MLIILFQCSKKLTYSLIFLSSSTYIRVSLISTFSQQTSMKNFELLTQSKMNHLNTHFTNLNTIPIFIHFKIIQYNKENHSTIKFNRYELYLIYFTDSKLDKNVLITNPKLLNSPFKFHTQKPQPPSTPKQHHLKQTNENPLKRIARSNF